jgi:hypothetical protein
MPIQLQATRLWSYLLSHLFRQLPQLKSSAHVPFHGNCLLYRKMASEFIVRQKEGNGLIPCFFCDCESSTAKERLVVEF